MISMTTYMQDVAKKVFIVTAIFTLCYMSQLTSLQKKVQRGAKSSHILLLGSARGADWHVGAKPCEHYNASRRLHHRACPC